MISKEKFIEYMANYKELEDIEDKIDEALKLLGKDLNGFYLDRHHTLMLNMLRDLVNDRNDYISYYIYECNWGKDKNNCVLDDCVEYSLDSYESLYDIIKLANND